MGYAAQSWKHRLANKISEGQKAPLKLDLRPYLALQ